MSNTNVVAFDAAKVPSLQMSEGELMQVLSNSLYPGAAPESIKLVISYCKAAGLDPMQKPVHIVPMDVKCGKDESGKDVYKKRDVIMPGVGTYRTQAARTGLYAGMSEPQFGPSQKMATMVKRWNNAHKGDRTFEMVEGPEMEFPSWCRITVRRLLGNQTVEFTALEYWMENYATAGNDTTAPNAMWKKRPFAQLAKCAEAQALRKAFPEFGAAPTADEMEGKEFVHEIDITPSKPPVDIEKWVAAASEATSADALKTVWADGVKAIKESGNKDAYAAFKATVEARGATLKAAEKPAIDMETGEVDDPFVTAMNAAEAA